MKVHSEDWRFASVRTPRSEGAVPTAAIPRTASLGSLSQNCGVSSHILAEREGFEPSVQVLARTTV